VAHDDEGQEMHIGFVTVRLNPLSEFRTLSREKRNKKRGSHYERLSSGSTRICLQFLWIPTIPFPLRNQEAPRGDLHSVFGGSHCQPKENENKNDKEKQRCCPPPPFFFIIVGEAMNCWLSVYPSGF